MSIKTILKIAGGILLVALLLFSIPNFVKLRAALRVPEKHLLIENQNSQLLEILPTPDDFSSEFLWHSVWIIQEDYESGESARSMLGGFYQWLSFSAITEVKQFTDDTKLSESAVEADFAFPISGELSDLNLNRISAVQKTNCYYWDDNTSECDVVIVYADKVIGLQIKLDAGADKSLLEKLANDLLSAIQEDLE